MCCVARLNQLPKADLMSLLNHNEENRPLRARIGRSRLAIYLPDWSCSDDD